MKRRRQIALNKLFNLFMILGFFAGWGAIDLLIDAEFAWAIGLGVLALLCILVPAVFMPFCYSFDCEGLTLCYIFLPNERYLWKNIYAIEVEVDDISFERPSVLFDFFYASVFSIHGQNEGEAKFYMQGQIRKSFRNKRLLEKYWDGQITGYLFEDVKAWWNKRSRKKQNEIKQHLTDEIVPMEREARAKARACIKPFIDQAAQIGLVLHTEYLYIPTKEYAELKSRPHAGYNYAVLVEISRPDETDDARIVSISVDLLYVRLGKTAYKGVENDFALTELREYITDVLDEIQQNGIEAYCKTANAE